MNKKILTLTIAFIILILLSLKTFSQSYLELESSIDEERTNYIEEIEYQLVSRLNEIENNIHSILNSFSYIFEEKSPTTFDEIKSLNNQINPSIENYKLVLISDAKKCYTLDGSSFIIKDENVLDKLVINSENFSSFVKLSNNNNYFIKSKTITPFIINNEKIVSIMIVIKEEVYREKMNLASLDNRVMIFLCDKNGKILLNPKYDKYNFLDNNNNLIESLRESNVKLSIIDKISNDLKNNNNSHKYFQINKKFLIQYALINDRDEFIVSLVSISGLSNNLLENVSQTVQMAYIALFLILVIILILVVVLFNFIDERNKNKLESHIREKEAISRSDFLSQMSHDMRTPLSAIVGMSKLAEQNLNNEIKLKESINSINFSANYLLEIINDVLDLNKLESGKLKLNNEAFSLLELINTVEILNQPKAKEKDLFFKVNSNIDSAICYKGDKLRITQILMNLISNAIKFTPENGYVNIYIQSQELNKNIDQIKFIIEDTGIGMSKEFINNLFVPYVQENLSITSKYGGSGLGLSIVDNLVKLMNGSIKVDSEKGSGSTFIVDLKLHKTKCNNINLKDKLNKFDFSKLNILFIEDHKINRLIGEKQLLSLGIKNIDSVENGKIGIEYFYKKPIGYYSLIITDIRMPMVDGYQLINIIRTLKRSDNTIPIIVMSANSKDEKIKTEYKIDATLCKPVNIDDLKRTIYSICKA